MSVIQLAKETTLHVPITSRLVRSFIGPGQLLVTRRLAICLSPFAIFIFKESYRFRSQAHWKQAYIRERTHKLHQLDEQLEFVEEENRGSRCKDSASCQRRKHHSQGNIDPHVARGSQVGGNAQKTPRKGCRLGL